MAVAVGLSIVAGNTGGMSELRNSIVAPTVVFPTPARGSTPLGLRGIETTIAQLLHRGRCAAAPGVPGVDPNLNCNLVCQPRPL